MNTRTISSHVPFSRMLAGIGGMASSFHFEKEGGEAGAQGDTRDPGLSFSTLRQEYARLETETDGILKTAEADNGRDLKPDEKTQFDAKFARMKSISETIDRRTKFAAMKLADPSAQSDGTIIVGRGLPGKGDADFANGTGGGGAALDFTKASDREQFGIEVAQWALTGQLNKKFATITTGTQSSLLLPKAVAAPIVANAANSLREGYAAWGLPVFSTPGDTGQINIPVLDPTAGGQVAENASSETENTPGMTESIISTPKTYQSGSVWFSNLQLSATRYDLLNAFGPSMAMNKELGLESVIIAAMIADAGITQIVTTATTTGFTYANSVQLANKLPKRYQQFKIRLLSATAYAAAEGLVDDNNRPVMVTDPQNQTLKKMHGVPTIRCDYLETLAANHTVGLEISLIGFHLRDAGEGIARYTQSPGRPDQTGINLFGYHAYGWAASAVAKLKTPAS
jgi:HK97 family phage major capsid protein